MNLLNKIIKKFKENVFWLFLIELFCLFFTVLLAFFGYNEIQSRLNLVQTFEPKLTELSNRLQGTDLKAEDVLEISNQLSNIEANTQLIKLLVILVPLGMFLIYSLFQGISWHSISGDKFNIKKIIDRKYLLTFLGVSLIYSFVLYLLWFFLYKLLSLNIFFPVILLITLILLYFLFVSYGVMWKYKQVFSSISKGFKIGFNSIGKLAIIMLGFIILSFGFFTLATLSSSIIIYAIFGVLILLLWILFKITLTEKLKEII